MLYIKKAKLIKDNLLLVFETRHNIRDAFSCSVKYISVDRKSRKNIATISEWFYKTKKSGLKHYNSYKQ